MNVAAKLKLSFSEKLTRFLKDNDLPSYILGLSVAQEIIQQGNVALLNLLTPEIKKEVLDIADCYKKDGECIYYSNIGMADHTDTAKALYELFVRNGVIKA